MNRLRELFDSPEYYPVHIDFQRRQVKFVRMSRENYRDSVFLDLRTRHTGSEVEIRLDDLLLASASEPAPERQVHYILHTSFCCSTLLARYFELLPSCFVLKEPRLLAQMALSACRSGVSWDAVFNVSLRLLTRAYEPQQMVVIKPNDWCNPLGVDLLKHNNRATISFLMTPLRHYLLAILKAEERRDWIRKRIIAGAKEAAGCRELADVNPARLTVPEAIAYMWLTHRFLYRNMASNRRYQSRVLLLNGASLASSPEAALKEIARLCRLPLGDRSLRELVVAPSACKYSKDLSRPYDAGSRLNEIQELELCWGAEADAGVAWASCHGATKGVEQW
jgi:hypothetical protein